MEGSVCGGVLWGISSGERFFFYGSKPKAARGAVVHPNRIYLWGVIDERYINCDLFH